MYMTGASKLPLISPPIILDFEHLPQYMLEEKLTAFLKPVSSDSRILV
jgi:hypothetical protein